LVVALGSQLSLGCGTSRPIVLEPSVPKSAFSSIGCPDTQASFRLLPGEDKRGYSNSRNIGFTQTGLFNRDTGLETRQEPAEILTHTLSAFLAHCGRLATNVNDARYALTPVLLTLQVTEQTSAFSEEIFANLKYESLVVDQTSGRRVGRPSSSGGGSVSSIADTTEYAEQVVLDALVDSLPTFARGLKDYK
jgi:hypothetical protein